MYRLFSTIWKKNREFRTISYCGDITYQSYVCISVQLSSALSDAHHVEVADFGFRFASYVYVYVLRKRVDAFIL